MDKIWLYAIVGSFIPILFWLFFWLKTDSHQPEPKKLIIKTFIFGAMAAFFAVWIEFHISKIEFTDNSIRILLYSFVEEFAKLSVVFLAAFGSVWNNERADPMFYMITGALGFVAIENMYYIVDYIYNEQYLQSLIVGSYRFIGATLLHIITSAVIGFFISLVFFQRKYMRIIMAFIGLTVATLIHWIFNLFVMHPEIFYQKFAFYGAWALVLFLLILFEIINKKERYRVAKSKIIYSSTKKTAYYKNKSKVQLSKKERVSLENKQIIEPLSSDYNVYKKESFRKKFF